MTNAPSPLSVLDDPDNIGDVDGRTLRRQRNRDAVIDSLIELIREGDLDPTVAKIADRAAVSHRSVFRYFDDLNDLARTAIETEVRNALPLAVIANVGEGSLEHRIEAMIASRMRILTRTHTLIRVARSKSVDLPEIDRGLSNVSMMTRDQFGRHFAAELDATDPQAADHITNLLTTQMGFEGYDHQRRMLDRSDVEIVEAWRLMLRKLLS